MPPVAYAISLIFRVYIALIFVWVLGSWFPQWQGQAWFQLVAKLVQPYLELFRALPLRMGMIDLTPVVAILVLILFESLLVSAAGGH